MRRSLLSLFVVGALVVGLAPAASALSPKWTAKGGRAFMDSAIGPDGSIYVAGVDRSSITAAATLRKFSPQGDLRWTRHWVSSPQDSANGVAVAVGNDGTVYLLGVARGTCEGEGWFVRAYTPGGNLRWKYLTPGFRCKIAEFPTDIAVRGNLVVVSGFSHGCCGDPFMDGWVTGFSRTLVRRWRANVEPPPPTPASYFDSADGVAISSGGAVFASGWAATNKITSETSPRHGSPILVKISGNGARLWSKRAGVSMPTEFLPVSLGLRGKRVAIAAGVEGSNVSWGSSPTTGWVGVYTLGGDFRWQDRFGGSRKDASAPTGVTVGGQGRVWVLGERRDASDRGIDGLLRWYNPKGSLHAKLRIDRQARYLSTGGIAAVGSGAVATGYLGQYYQFKGGLLWRLVG
jgi:hypothetical protein